MSEDVKELPVGWANCALEEVLAEIRGGGTPSKANKEYFEGDIPLMTVKDMKLSKPSKAGFNITKEALENSSAKMVPADTVIIATRMGLGKVIRPTVDTAINQDLKALFPTIALDKELLEKWVLANATKLEAMGTGTTVKGIRLTQLREMNFPLPPLAEQERIVDKIDELFSSIEAGERAIARARTALTRYRKAVLKAAVTGELTADWRAKNPPTETAEALLERILKARYAAWEKTELEKLDAKGKARPKTDKEWVKFRARYKEPVGPKMEEVTKLSEGWCWSTLEQLVGVETGATPKKATKEFYENGKIPWVTSTAVNSRKIMAGNDFITDKALQETNAKVFPAGSLIIAMYGEGKTRGKVSKLGIDAATNQACAALMVTDLKAETVDYIELFFLQAYNRMRSKAAGGVQPNLNLSIIRETTVALPPLDEQAEIVSRVEEALSKADAVEVTLDAQARQAKALKQAVLKTAFEGKLVPQNPKDEPASELLKRIKEEK